MTLYHFLSREFLGKDYTLQLPLPLNTTRGRETIGTTFWRESFSTTAALGGSSWCNSLCPWIYQGKIGPWHVNYAMFPCCRNGTQGSWLTGSCYRCWKYTGFNLQCLWSHNKLLLSVRLSGGKEYHYERAFAISSNENLWRLLSKLK